MVRTYYYQHEIRHYDSYGLSKFGADLALQLAEALAGYSDA